MPVRTVTITAGATTTVNLSNETNVVAVYNLAGSTGDIIAGLGSIDPVPDANDTYRIPVGARRELNWGRVTGKSVRLYCAGAAKAEVEWQ